MALIRTHNQKVTISVNMATLMTNKGKALGDITAAYVTLRAKSGFGYSATKVYDKNSTDHASYVSFAENADSELIISAIVDEADFTAGPIRSNYRYTIGAALVFSDETSTTTFELDSYFPSSNEIIFVPEIVDTLDS